MNIKVNFDSIEVKEDKNDFNVKVLMLKGEKGDPGDGEDNVIEKVQVNGTDLPVTNKTVNVQVPVVDSSISSSSTNPVQNSAIYNELSNKVDTSALSNYYEVSEVDTLLSEKPYLFDNVAEMKLYDLQEGNYVITKGYYSANDGGGASYYITNNQSDSEYQEKLGNNLYANLIIDGYININSLGADSTGETDSSTIIQKALDFINYRWTNELYDINTIVFNGTYLINNTLEMSPFAKITGDGFVTFLTNASPVIWLHYPSGTIPASFPGGKLQYQYANLIDFPKGCLFKNISGERQNTCIEIGEHSDLTVTHNVARFKLCNFCIQNYNIGIKYNPYNVYICNHERIQIELNAIAVKFGDSTLTPVNSGEHIVFDNCLIANNTYGFLYEVRGFDIDVVNSSIDFNTYIVSDPYAKAYHKINFSNSHIEGNTHFLGTIGYPSFINIFNNKLFWSINSESKNQFMTLDDIDNSVTSATINNMASNVCNIKNNSINIPREGTTHDPEYVLFISYMNVLDIDNFYQSETVKPQVKFGNILSGVFDDLSDGDVTISTNSTLNNGRLKVVANSNFKTTGRIVTDNYLYQGHKSLVLYKNADTTNECNFNIETGLIPVKKNMYVANWYTYNKKLAGSIRYYYYDKDGNELSHTDSYQYNPTAPTTNNNWYASNYSKKAVIPLNAAYFKVVFYLGNWNNLTAEAEDTQYKLGGLIIN